MSKIDKYLPGNKWAFATIIILILVILFIVRPESLEFVGQIFSGIGEFISNLGE